MRIVLQFGIGLLFGLGLIVAGMSDPAKVLNFLDLAGIATGMWDASLAFVLGAAVIVTAIGYRLVLRQPRPVLATEFHLPHKTRVEWPVIVGPAIFGLGWGLVGLCPGPAFVALGTGSTAAVAFVGAMLAGMIVARRLALSSLRLGTA